MEITDWRDWQTVFTLGIIVGLVVSACVFSDKKARVTLAAFAGLTFVLAGFDFMDRSTVKQHLDPVEPSVELGMDLEEGENRDGSTGADENQGEESSDTGPSMLPAGLTPEDFARAHRMGRWVAKDGHTKYSWVWSSSLTRRVTSDGQVWNITGGEIYRVDE